MKWKSNAIELVVVDRQMDILGALILGVVLIFVLRIVLLAVRGWWQSRGNPPKPKQSYREWKD